LVWVTDHLLGDFYSQRRDARAPGLVAQEPGDALLHEALWPAPDAVLALTGAPGDLDRAEAGDGQQDDLRPPNMLLRADPVRDNRLQSGTIGGTHIDDDILAHSPRLTPTDARGNPRTHSCGTAG
jgi:hypothetical protein